MTSVKKTYVAYSIALVALLQACSGGDSSPAAPTPGVGGSFLHVSVPDFYFGTRDVGTQATQKIEITNRGGDIYPIKTIKVTGDHSDEFTTDFYDEIVLQPAEAIELSISFEPITDGRKSAALDIDFDTITQVSAADNLHEQNFYRAKDLENAGEYDQSLAAYDDYIHGNPVTKNKQRAAIKAPVLKEASLYGDGPDFNLYLNAVNARNSGELDLAVAELDALELLHNDSYLADDAAYMRAYIDLIDKKDYAAAEKNMKQLRTDYPDSNYYDTALYSEGLAHQEMGNRQLARNIFEDLKYRHTGAEAFGIELSKDNILSRMWFERAEEALDALDS